MSDIYATPDFSKKLRNKRKEEKDGEREEKDMTIYANLDFNEEEQEEGEKMMKPRS